MTTGASREVVTEMVPVQVYMPAPLRDELRDWAVAHDVSMSQALRLLVRRAMRGAPT